MIPLLREQVAQEILGLTIIGDNDPKRGHPGYVCRGDIRSYEAEDEDANEIRAAMERKGFTLSVSDTEVCFSKGGVTACADEQPRPKAICIAALRALRKEKERTF